MHRLFHPYRFAILVVMLLVCTGVSSAAPSDHPVVTAITGPNNLNDGYMPTGSYVFMASVSGGSPPYTYRWFVVPDTTSGEEDVMAPRRWHGLQYRIPVYAGIFRVPKTEVDDYH